MTVTQNGERIRLEGDLDIDAVAQVREALIVAATKELDLAGVTGCDAAGVQLILAAQADARVRNTTLLVVDVPPLVSQTAASLGVTLAAE